MTQPVDELIEAAERRWKAGWETGPTRLRWTSLPPQAGDPAPDATLAGHCGRPDSPLVPCGQSDPVLLLFLASLRAARGGMDRAERLRTQLGDYHSASGDVCPSSDRASRARAARYRERQALDVPILA